MLPEGFSNLVAISIENWDWDVLPREDPEVWDKLLYPVFLGRTVRSAQASYIKEVLNPHLQMEVARAVRTDPYWSEKVLRRIDLELGSIAGTLGEGLKRAILNKVTQDIRSLDLSQTIDTALSFFERFHINVERIKSVRNDDNATDELVVNAAKEIHDVSYIKAVLWLYNCGIGYYIVPPNSHIRRFLAECGYSGFGWSRDKPEDWQIYALANAKMREVAQQVSTELRGSITPKQSQAAVWYLQTCRGVLPRKFARKLSPQVLIDFLRDQRWNIDQLADRLNNIEKLENLAEDLKRFLSIIC